MKALKIDHLRKQYCNGVLALKDISLEVEPGEFFGLLGPNGAGKSTTIGIVSSLINKTKGKIQLFGYDLDKQATQAKALIGLVPQEFNFGMFEKVIDILITQAGYYGIAYSIARKRAEYYLKKLDLWDKAQHTPRVLSGGMKRRLLIARGLIHQPKLLILDEPTAGVDIEIRRMTWGFLQELNEQGTTIILTTHNLEEAETLCRQVAIINHGEIIENTSVKQLIAQLDRETYILDLKTPITSLPSQLEGFEFTQVDALTIEVSFHKKTSLNQLFTLLTAHNYEIISLRNKVNRLEELFMYLVKK